jgi:hypothetical protein
MLAPERFLSRPIRKRTTAHCESHDALDRHNCDDLIDLEFSDYGRSRRFVSGWWIVPGLLLGASVLVLYFLA